MRDLIIKFLAQNTTIPEYTLECYSNVDLLTMYTAVVAHDTKHNA